jgi:hypothetical protein
MAEGTNCGKCGKSDCPGTCPCPLYAEQCKFGDKCRHQAKPKRDDKRQDKSEAKPKREANPNAEPKTTTCRFGEHCTRPDCHFDHPAPAPTRARARAPSQASAPAQAPARQSNPLPASIPNIFPPKPVVPPTPLPRTASTAAARPVFANALFRDGSYGLVELGTDGSPPPGYMLAIMHDGSKMFIQQ